LDEQQKDGALVGDLLLGDGKAAMSSLRSGSRVSSGSGLYDG